MKNKNKFLIITSVLLLVTMFACSVSAYGNIVASNGDVGQHSSIAMDNQGNSHIAYYDPAIQKLKYCNDISGSWACVTLTPPYHETDNVGEYPSIAIDDNGKIHISFSDVTNDEMAYCTNKDGSWACASVAYGSGETSIALDSNNLPHIAIGGGDLDYCQSNGQDITYDWDCMELASHIPFHSSDPSVAVDSNDFTHISYYDSGYLHYCTDSSGSWVCEKADQADDAGFYSSIVADSNNNIHISHYYYAYDYDLRYCNNAMGSWTCSNIDTEGRIGKYTSMEIGGENNLYVSYYDSSNGDLKYCTDENGLWSCSTVDSTGDVGKYTDIAVDINKNSHILYYDSTNGDLKYCDNVGGDWNCQESQVPSDEDDGGDDGTPDDSGKVNLGLIFFIGAILTIGIIVLIFFLKNRKK